MNQIAASSNLESENFLQCLFLVTFVLVARGYCSDNLY